MKELMRGIKIAAEPINQHNCAQNDTEAISNTGQGAKGGGAVWACSECTFENHPELQECEICGNGRAWCV